VIGSIAVRLRGAAGLRRVAIALVPTLLLLGCAPSGVPVHLATGPGEFPEGPDGVTPCVTYFNVGFLIPDAEYGTAATGTYGSHELIWPLGYTARRVEGRVVVLNRSGDVVATTGHTYQFWTGNWGDGGGPVHTGGTGCVNPYDPGTTPPPYQPQVIVRPELPRNDPN